MGDIYQELNLMAVSENTTLLDITDCGASRNGETLSFESRDFLLIYVGKGSGELCASIRAYSLFAGEFMLCLPNETKSFEPTAGEKTELLWFSFKGRVSTEILSTLNFSSKEKYFLGHDSDVLSFLNRIAEEFEKHEPNAPIICSSLLVAALATMSRLSIHTAPLDHTKGYEKIAPALSSINSDCTSKTGVDEYAKMCNLSTSYFTHLFTKITGFSPMEYKQQQRIGIAKNLLSTTNLSVKEVSSIIGFKDPLYFGRCFKQATGLTPSGYRSKK